MTVNKSLHKAVLRSVFTASALFIAASTNTALGYVGLDSAYTGVEYDSVMQAPTDLSEDIRFSFTPSIGLSATYDDNIYRTEIDENSAMIYKVLPVLEASGLKNRTTYKLGYRGNYGFYSGGPNDELDDYMNHVGYAGVYHTGSKTSSSLYGDYQRGHTPKGADNQDEKDEWNQGSVIGKIDMGELDDLFRLRLTGLAKNREYDYNKANDLDNKGVGAVLGVRIGPKTRLVLDGGYVRFDYPNSNRDADRNYLRAGVTWQASAKTTGFFSYGKEEYRPDDSGQSVESDETGTAQGFVEDNDSSTWKGVLTWLPRNRDSITLETSRRTAEGFGIGSNRVATRSFISWGHTWSERISSTASYRFGNDDYIGAPRNDDIENVYLGLGYIFKRNHIIRGYWNHENRDSNIPLESYDQNRYTLLYGYSYQ